jgi:cell division protein ZapA
MKQIEAQIMDQSYMLSCSEDGEAGLLRAVERVNAAMCKIRDAGRIKARDRIAVLAALNLAFELTEPQPLPATAAPDDQSLSTAISSNGSDEQATLVHLLKRLNQALEEDGQLL